MNQYDQLDQNLRLRSKFKMSMYHHFSVCKFILRKYYFFTELLLSCLKNLSLCYQINSHLIFQYIVQDYFGI